MGPFRQNRFCQPAGAGFAKWVRFAKTVFAGRRGCVLQNGFVSPKPFLSGWSGDFAPSMQ